MYQSTSRQWPYWLITIAVFIGLPGITLIQDGMFMDAMLYTSVAHNQAIGFGTFWFPQFSTLNLNIEGIHSFHEQPPLAFGIQSVFFRLFGDSMYVERFYVFVTSCLTALLIHFFWRAIFKEKENIRKMSWLPILLWITIPTVFWGAANNVNENTMGIFTLASVLCSYLGLQQSGGRKWLYLILAGINICLATLTKGFPGFFPLGIPFLYWLTTRKISFPKSLVYSLILLAIPAAFYTILFTIPESKESLSIYLFKRAFQRMANVPTTTNRFASLEKLLMDLLPMIGLLLIAFLIGKWKKVQYEWVANKRMVLFLALTGLSASAPLMLTMVQKGFYLIPCFPYFGLAGACLLAPYIFLLQKRITASSSGFKILVMVSVLLLSGAITAVAMMKGKTSRDNDRLHDVYTIGKIIPKNTDVSVTLYTFYEDPEVVCYLVRYFNIYSDLRTGRNLKFLLLNKNEQPDKGMNMSAYRKLDLPLQRYDLYELK